MENTRWPTQEEVGMVREKYPVGTEIRLIEMQDAAGAALNGLSGIVQYVDDAGQIHMRWENGSILALIPGVDNFEIVS